MKLLFDLLSSLPALIKLIKILQKIDKEVKVKDDVKKINKAFEDKDEKALRDLF